MVHGILLARVPPCDVADLLQEVFLTAWQRLPSRATPRRSAAGWR